MSGAAHGCLPRPFAPLRYFPTTVVALAALAATPAGLPCISAQDRCWCERTGSSCSTWHARPAKSSSPVRRRQPPPPHPVHRPPVWLSCTPCMRTAPRTHKQTGAKMQVPRLGVGKRRGHRPLGVGQRGDGVGDSCNNCEERDGSGLRAWKGCARNLSRKDCQSVPPRATVTDPLLMKRATHRRTAAW